MFDVKAPQDVHAVLKKLDGVESQDVRVALVPGKGRPYNVLVPSTSAAPAVFSIGSQPIIDQWYQRLAVESTGARVFGAHRYTQQPTAAPPTLRLYVGSDAVDLPRLMIPTRFELVAEISGGDEANAAYVADIETIRRYIADPYLQRRRRSQLRFVAIAAIMIAAGVLAIVVGRHLTCRRVRSPAR